MTVSDLDFEMLVNLAYRHSLDDAIDRMRRSGRYTEDELRELRSDFVRRADSAQNGYPPKIIALPHGEPWYAGPQPEDRYWPALRLNITASGAIPGDQLDILDDSTTKIVAYTHNPASQRWTTRGLVVGYVQSGKTTNFTAVIAKAVDLGYNLVIVLSGIHNGLRKQTQERLEEQLCELHRDGWVTLTDVEHDFRRPGHTIESVLPHAADRRAVLVVVKKNAAVLRKLVRWLEESSRQGGLGTVKALVIDDEADQATVATPKINPLIRDMLRILQRHTFIGYTATPFANVLIDPSDDDLYPKDFILNLPRPDRYFGTEMIFGRDELPEGGEDAPVDGYDMVRIIDDVEATILRPPRQGLFEPDLTPSLEDATLWFWLATATRRVRGDDGHSTMLMHTSMKTSVHQAFRDPLIEFQRDVLHSLRRGDKAFEARLHELWTRETSRVAADDFPDLQLTTPEYIDVRAEIEAVVSETRVVLDNSRSLERLDYRSGCVTAIAIGGNTLSRGLTLEGLVVSFFIRSAGAYDTLLQMGRWFGFRIGYEDLPRIYMTQELRKWFRHLAMVEHEIRLDINRYEEQGLTPIDFGPRIRTHPTLLATQKLGAARQAFTSYGGRRVQVRYFRHRDADWLNSNLLAASSLVAQLDASGIEVERQSTGSALWRDVPVVEVRRFLSEYQCHPDSPDMDQELLIAYLDKELAAGSLSRWSVAVMGAADDVNGTVSLGAHTFGRIIRARLDDGEADRADIKTLMSKEHRVADMDILPSVARGMAEEKLMDLRNADPMHHNRGLLLLYPIDPASPPGTRESLTRRPLEAAADVIGLALVFPGNAQTTVQNSYISVDLSGVAPLEDPDDTDDLIDDDAESVGV